MKQVVKNSMRKNQLEEDFKEVQMVRQLFENENKTEHKILSDKRQKEAKFKHQQKEKDTQKNGKTKHIKKQSNKWTYDFKWFLKVSYWISWLNQITWNLYNEKLYETLLTL